MVIINKVLAENLTKNTKIVHFTQNIDILRKGEGDGQFPIGKPIEFLINIWYNCYKYQWWIIVLKKGSARIKIA